MAHFASQGRLEGKRMLGVLVACTLSPALRPVDSTEGLVKIPSPLPGLFESPLRGDRGPRKGKMCALTWSGRE